MATCWPQSVVINPVYQMTRAHPGYPHPSLRPERPIQIHPCLFNLFILLNFSIACEKGCLVMPAIAPHLGSKGHELDWTDHH